MPEDAQNLSKKEGMVRKMEVTNVKIRRTFDDSPMKAIASITIDNMIAVHDVKVIYAKEKYFVVMPSKRNSNGTFRDIVHPINTEFRTILEDAVRKAYFAELEAAGKSDGEADADEAAAEETEAVMGYAEVEAVGVSGETAE